MTTMARGHVKLYLSLSVWRGYTRGQAQLSELPIEAGVRLQASTRRFGYPSKAMRQRATLISTQADGSRGDILQHLRLPLFNLSLRQRSKSLRMRVPTVASRRRQSIFGRGEKQGGKKLSWNCLEKRPVPMMSCPFAAAGRVGGRQPRPSFLPFSTRRAKVRRLKLQSHPTMR